MPNPYSRTEWTELQQQFRPPPDGPAVSTRLRDYATAEEIGVVVFLPVIAVFDVAPSGAAYNPAS